MPKTSCHCIRHFGGHLCKMAAIYKVIRLSQKLGGAEPSISTLCLGFVGRGFQKKILPNTPCHCIHHFGGHLKKMAAISKVVRLSQKLRDILSLSSISTLCQGSVGSRLAEKVLCRIYVSTRINHFDVYGGHFTKCAHMLGVFV